MKKMILILLMVTLVLTLTLPALAEQVLYLEDWGMTVTVPDGMTAVDVSGKDAAMLQLTVDGRDDLVYIIQFSYDETFAGRTLNDITDEEAEELGTQLAQAYPNPEFADYIDEENDVVMLLVNSGDQTSAAILTIHDGIVINVLMVNNGGEPLTEDEAILGMALLTTLSFDE
ncbi:MAG: hypothetical protein GX096_00440 [Clostridiales bacterium]|nr:hypothetical protein [Clostridiales bacterium]